MAVVQKIEWDDEDEAIRFGYYTKQNGRWNWGSQNTWCFAPKATRELLKKAEDKGII